MGKKRKRGKRGEKEEGKEEEKRKEKRKEGRKWNKNNILFLISFSSLFSSLFIYFFIIAKQTIIYLISLPLHLHSVCSSPIPLLHLCIPLTNNHIISLSSPPSFSVFTPISKLLFGTSSYFFYT
jgi:heme/copper-type cytochrome/quinol oxidase subunit 3